MPWKNTPSKAINQYRKTFDKGLRASAIRVLRCVVRESRVDTGAFRANWNVENGFPSLTYNLDMTDKGGTSTIAKGSAKMRGDLSRIYISNSVPYAVVMNYGRPPGVPWGPTTAKLYWMEECVQKESVKLNRKKANSPQVLR